ncbi:pectate lyase [Zhihengliuella somnathii]
MVASTIRKFTALIGACAVLATTTAGSAAGAAPGPAGRSAAPGDTFSIIDQAPGWAAENGGTNGGAEATAESTYVVENRRQLFDALANNGARDEPKIVYISGTIHGNETDDGRLLGEQDYAPGYDVQKYISCFGDEGWSDQLHDYCQEQRHLRSNGSRAMKSQTEISIPTNTTLVGLGEDAGLDQATVMLHLAHNVVIRNLTIEAPVDHFSSWDPYDGEEGAWNARFDAMSSVASTNIWVDHVTLTDGAYLDRDAPVGPNGKPMNRHDGLFDMKDGSDFITMSNSYLKNHDKTMLLGSGDDNADTDEGRLRISLIGNFFDGIQQRAPRVRFGQVHVVNNYFLGRVKDPASPMTSAAMGGHDYFLGLGYKSQVFSERNSFDYTGPGADATVAVHVWNATRFLDEGSWFKQRPVDLHTIAADQYAERVAEAAESGEPLPDWATAGFTPGVDWTPPYDYEPMTTPAAVERHARTGTGAGRLSVTAP